MMANSEGGDGGWGPSIGGGGSAGGPGATSGFTGRGGSNGQASQAGLGTHQVAAGGSASSETGLDGLSGDDDSGLSCSVGGRTRPAPATAVYALLILACVFGLRRSHGKVAAC